MDFFESLHTYNAGEIHVDAISSRKLNHGATSFNHQGVMIPADVSDNGIILNCAQTTGAKERIYLAEFQNSLYELVLRNGLLNIQLRGSIETGRILAIHPNPKLGLFSEVLIVSSKKPRVI